MSLLEVTELNVSFDTADGVVHAVRGLSFHVDRGSTLGIVGESGSGKSVGTQTLLRLIPEARVSGRAMFDGEDLLSAGEQRLRKIRGARIGVVFQDPLSGLHPLYKVGRQIEEMIREHERGTSRAQARGRAIEMLGLVGIPRPERRVDDYPHQFSGGMRQRAMIAMALALNPLLIIADEPTTALDATVAAQLLDLLRRLQREFGAALIMITHDLGVIADMADEVLVMYGGKPVESAGRRALYYRHHHPYTKGLLESVPDAARGGRRLRPIAGRPPSLIHPPAGCVFHPRCPYASARCATDEPSLLPMPAEPAGSATVPHLSACWLPRTALGGGTGAELLRRHAAGGSGERRAAGPGAVPGARPIEEPFDDALAESAEEPVEEPVEEPARDAEGMFRRGDGDTGRGMAGDGGVR